MFGKKTGIYKALFVLEKALAVKDVINNSAKSIAQIKANMAIANMKALAASPLSGGMPWVAYNTALASKEILSTKLIAGVQIGQIAASTVKGFETGLYPVTRDDGKKFNAKLGGPTRTQIVSQPTLMQEYLVGERRRPEMIIDDITFSKMAPEVIQYILDVHKGLEVKRPGFEKGKYDTVMEVSENEEELEEEETNSTRILEDISSKLGILIERGIKATAIIGDDNIEQIRDREKEISNSRNQAKVE